jgi:hypothetical protein
MRKATTPLTETVEQFRDCNGAVWRVELHYPAGKAKGNDRYWVGTITKEGAAKPAITCAHMLQLDYEVKRLRQPTLTLA